MNKLTAKIKLIKYCKMDNQSLDTKTKEITGKYNMEEKDIEELTLIISAISLKEYSKAGLIKI